MSRLRYKTLRENVADEIRTRIMNQEYVPGMRIIEQNLSEELGVSRGPIREALRQLEQEGLLTYERNVGCSISSLDINDVYEIYLMRSTYEILAVRSYGGRFTESEFRRMESVLQRMRKLEPNDFQGVVECDQEFHGIIIKKSGMKRLHKAWEDLNYGSYLAVKNGGIYKEKLHERQYNIHRILLDSLKTGDLDFILKTIESHYMDAVSQMKREASAEYRVQTGCTSEAG